MTGDTSTDAQTEAFRAILAECIAALRAIPADTRDGWIQELDALADTPGGRTADDFSLSDLLMALRLVDVGRPAPAGGLPTMALHLTRVLHAVPRDVRQAWLDELRIRIEMGERVTSDEFQVAHVLVGLPVAEDIAAMIRSQETQPIPPARPQRDA